MWPPTCFPRSRSRSPALPAQPRPRRLGPGVDHSTANNRQPDEEVSHGCPLSAHPTYPPGRPMESPPPGPGTATTRRPSCTARSVAESFRAVSRGDLPPTFFPPPPSAGADPARMPSSARAPHPEAIPAPSSTPTAWIGRSSAQLLIWLTGFLPRKPRVVAVPNGVAVQHPDQGRSSPSALRRHARAPSSSRGRGLAPLGTLAAGSADEFWDSIAPITVIPSTIVH